MNNDNIAAAAEMLSRGSTRAAIMETLGITQEQYHRVFPQILSAVRDLEDLGRVPPAYMSQRPTYREVDLTVVGMGQRLAAGANRALTFLNGVLDDTEGYSPAQRVSAAETVLKTYASMAGNVVKLQIAAERANAEAKKQGAGDDRLQAFIDIIQEEEDDEDE